MGPLVTYGSYGGYLGIRGVLQSFDALACRIRVGLKEPRFVVQALGGGLTNLKFRAIASAGVVIHAR